MLPLNADRLEAFKIQRRFMNVNQLRVTRMKESLASHQQIFFHVLPLLFHANHSLMPGYLSKDCPSGVSDYSSNAATLRAARKLAKSFSMRKGVVYQVAGHSTYLMGSSGSIAQSNDNDFELWLCHRPELSEAALKLLRRKAQAVESWAADLGLEVHFFLMSARVLNPEQSSSCRV